MFSGCAFGGDDWLSKEVLQKAELQTHDDGGISLRWLDGPRVERVYYFDPKLRYAFVAYTRARKGLVYSTIHNRAFRRVDDLFLPFQSIYTEYQITEERASPSHSVIIDIDEYKLGDERNTKDDFRIEWPLNSFVSCADTGASVIVKSRPQKLDDATLSKAAKTND